MQKLDQLLKQANEKVRIIELRRYVPKRNRKGALLDIGCGEGLFVDLARKNGIYAQGIDKSISPSPHCQKISFEKYRTEQKYSIVCMYHLIEHLHHPLGALKKVFRLLDDQGSLVVELPLVGSLTSKLLGKDYFVFNDKTHLHFITKKEIYDLLERSGFSIRYKGCTLLEFPLTVITTLYRRGVAWAIIGTLVYLPLKILSLMGGNDEIIRLYCSKKGLKNIKSQHR